MANKALSGKTALVTGASQGIGLSCALLLAEAGAKVVITALNESELAFAKCEIIDQVPDADIEFIVADALDEEASKAAIEYAYNLSDQLDILVTTVGGHRLTKIVDETPNSVREIFELNFMSMFMAVHYALPRMQKGGSIVCISTTGVTLSYKGLGIYSAAKAALERFVKATAYELGGNGIRINAVRPGVTLSQNAIDELGVQAMVDQLTPYVPLGRIGVPKDVAQAVRFLAGPESSYVTGQVFSADGGQDQCRAPEFID